MSQANQILLTRLSRWGKLNEEDHAALIDVPIEVADYPANHDIARAYEKPRHSVMVISGLLMTYKFTLDGSRQVHSFYRSGDIPDLYSLHLTTLDASLGTVTPSKVGLIQHKHLHTLCEKSTRITAALWRSTLIDASIHREWLTNVGQRVAQARMAHLFCEEYIRSNIAGLAESGKRKACPFPVTQALLGEVLGLSTVHVNRTLQELREAKLITFEQGRLEILDWSRLAEKAGFDPAYLHLDDEGADRYHARVTRQADSPRGTTQQVRPA